MDNDLEAKIKKEYETIVVANDLHIPYEDKRAVIILKQYLYETQPDKFIIAGDLIDFGEISHFLRNPNNINAIQENIDLAEEYLKDFRKILPKSEIYYIIKGSNHEERLQKYLWSKAPELTNLRALKLQELLNLEKYNITPILNKPWIEIGNELVVMHGDLVRKFSGYTAHGMLDKYGRSVVFGHCHRIGIHYHTNSKGMQGAFENGCLCSLSPEYVFQQDWQQGFSIIYKKRGKNRFHIVQFPIIDGVAVIEGTEYRSDDLLKKKHKW